MAEHSIDNVIEDAEKTVSKFARVIALKRAGITAVVGALLQLGVLFDVITPDESSHVTGLIQIGLATLTMIGAGLWIHKGATPADIALDPKDSDGVPLIRVDAAAQIATQAAAAAVAAPPPSPVDLASLDAEAAQLLGNQNPPV